MDETNKAIQLVTFQLGEEIYGIDIMEVTEIVDYDSIRDIPNAPSYVEGLFNLRGGIIPIISLHRRFHIKRTENNSEKSLLILTIEGMKLGIVIDRILRVVPIVTDEIQDPPQVISGIGTEYIRGVVSRDDYLIVLDSKRLFDSEELRQISQYA